MERLYILLLADDPEMQQLWANLLYRKGFQAKLAKIDRDDFRSSPLILCNVIFIDVDIVRSSLLTIVRELASESKSPILLLAPIREYDFVLKAYQAGVSDYIAKPIDHRIMVAKIIAWSNQTSGKEVNALETIQGGEVIFDPIEKKAVIGETTVKLTHLECRLLYFLMKHPNQVLGPNMIIRYVWGYVEGNANNMLKNAIYRLRHKIEKDANEPQYIISLHGEGYLFHS